MGYAHKRGWYDAFSVPPQFQAPMGTYSNVQQPHVDLSPYLSARPSRTVLVTEFPGGCSENDVKNFLSRYGQVFSTKMICNGQAALVQFMDLSSSTHVFQLAKSNNLMMGPNRLNIEWAVENTASDIRSNATDRPNPSETYATHILHIDVAAADYPITVDVIRSICQPHGNLVRVFIGKRNVDRSLEVLVEFENIEQAKKAKEHLDGADIYSGCCSLTVTFSKLAKVHVTANGPESWDFTGPRGNVPGPLGSNSNQRTLLDTKAPPGHGAPQYPYAPSMPAQYPPPAPSSRGYPGQQLTPYYSNPGYTVPQMNVPPGYGYPPQYPQYNNSFTPAAPTAPAVPSTVPNVTRQSKPVKILPTPAPVHQVTAGGIGIGHATSNLTAPSPQSRQADPSLFETVEGVVLMVSNLPPSLNCDHLFNLICMYGNVARIKFLKSRPGCAMIQVGTAEAADFIHRYYNGVSLFGYTIQVNHTKQLELIENDNLGKLEDGSPVMKNYMADPNNRFRNSIVAAKSRILEPSRTLHFFNTPPDFSPEDVCKVLVEAGAGSPPRVVLFTTKAGQKTSLGLVEYDTLAEALEALALANQRPIHVADVLHPFHLKLAYSPKPISPDRFGYSLIRYPAPPFAKTRPGDGSKVAPALDVKAVVAEDQRETETTQSGESNGKATDSQFQNGSVENANNGAGYDENETQNVDTSQGSGDAVAASFGDRAQ